jgi:hypothetical protein
MYRCGLYTFVLTDAIARPTQLGHNLTFSTAGMLCPEYLSLTQVRWTEPVGVLSTVIVSAARPASF